MTRLIKIAELTTIVGFGKTTLWGRVKKGTFPKPVICSDGSPSLWRSSDIEAWINGLSK